MSDDNSEEKPPFPRAKLAFYVIGSVVAIPLAKSGWDALMAGDYVRGGFALAAGAVSATAAFSFEYWESHLAEPTRKLIRDLLEKKAIIATIVLLFAAYSTVVIPDLMKKITSDQPSFNAQLDLANQKIASLQSQLDTKTRELSSAQNELNKMRTGSNPTPQPQTLETEKSPPTAVDVAIKISIWESVSTVNLRALINAYNKMDELLSSWSERIKSQEGRDVLSGGLANSTAAYMGASGDLEILRTAYPNYPDVSSALIQLHRADLAKASADFSNAVLKGDPNYSSPDYANKLRPLAGALRREMKVTVDWLNDLRKTAATQLNALSK
jgi:hypothetical protein